MNKILTFSKNGYVPIMVTKEPFDVQPILADRSAICNIIVIREDCNVKTTNGYIEAKKGDIAISFYEEHFPNKIVVVTSKEWLENIDTYNEKMNECKNCKNSCCDLSESN